MSSQQKPQSGFTPIIPKVANNPRTGTNPNNQSQNFFAQAKAKANASKPGSVKPLTNDCDEFCRSKFSVFGQITFPIIILVVLLTIAAVIIFFSVRYYKSKVKIANSSLISKPTSLSTSYRIPNSNNSPTMISNEFSYQFWLYITPPTTVSNSNFLVFLRDSDTFPPRFCIYFSDNGSTLNVASLLSGDPSSISNEQKTYIKKLQFDLLPDFYLVSSTRQISFYKWFFVSVVGFQNQLVLYVNAVPYDTQIKPQNRSLQIHSGYIDIAYTNNNTIAYNTLDNSYISKLLVYNYPINQTLMQSILKYSPQ